jgi:hypothetical protein
MEVVGNGVAHAAGEIARADQLAGDGKGMGPGIEIRRPSVPIPAVLPVARLVLGRRVLGVNEGLLALLALEEVLNLMNRSPYAAGLGDPVRVFALKPAFLGPDCRRIRRGS